jgi:protein-tyrosine phosphatase
MEKIRVLFVCLGNICRSPLAEAVFNHKIQQSGLDGHFEVDSCGTGDYHIGEPPDPRTLANARKNGISVNHFCRQLTVDDLSYFDYVLAMDNSNLQNILSLDGSDHHSHKVSLLREFDSEGKGLEVPDPYFGGEEGFDLVYSILDRSLDGFIAYVRQTHSVS